MNNVFISSAKKDEVVENFAKSKREELEKMIPNFVNDMKFTNIVLNFYERGIRDGAQMMLGRMTGNVVDGICISNGVEYTCTDTLKQEWSEEDEMMLQYAIEHFERQKRNCVEGGGRKKAMQEFIDWLKSLRPQNRWKPSNEQIEILDMVLTNESMDDNVARILRELREQLKKLKE